MCDSLSAGYSLLRTPSPANGRAMATSTPVAIIGPMSVGHLSDEELTLRFRATTDSADRELCINELFRRNYSKVGRWCLRFTDNRETAADLSQEVFTKAYQNLRSFQGQSKFSTWLFVIARNHCLNAVRSNIRQATELKAEIDENFLSEIPDETASPYDEVERQSSAKLVSDLLSESLDETEKVVFTLHYGEDVPLDTISRMLRLENRSGAKAFIVSAKRKLARLVQQRTARKK